MATEADLIQKFKDLNIPVGADFEELIHAAFAGANLADLVNNYDSRITTVENDLSTAKDSIQSNTDNKVTDNKNGTITVNGTSIIPADENVIARIDLTYKDMNDITMGWFYVNGWADVSGLSNWGLPQGFYYVHCFKTGFGPSANIQIAYGVTLNSTYVRTMSGTTWTTWKLLADDSKVAHLSGDNNFDTVPTVNNNPLLLASSLPSDLARTGQDTNFTGKLQKSGIDVATKTDVTTAVNTATANMVDSSKPTNFTAGLKSGGVDVATAADLKSVADKAWYQLDNKYITPASGSTLDPSTNILYKIEEGSKKLYVQGTIKVINNSSITVSIALTSIVKTILTVSGLYLGYSDGSVPSYNFIYHKLSMSAEGITLITNSEGDAVIFDSPYITYDELI